MEQVRRVVCGIKQNTGLRKRIGEVGFLGFYGIMVVMKAMGYVSYEMTYKAAFAVALCCLAVKVFTTRYTMREFLILYAMLAVSAVCWWRVGEKNVLFITLCLWGMKDVCFETLMKETVGFRVTGTLLMILLACVGILDMQPGDALSTHFRAIYVYAFGYTKSNAAFYMIFLCVAVALYVSYEKLGLRHFAVSLAVCYAGFLATYCRTGMILFVALWALIVLDKLSRRKAYYRLLACNTLALCSISFLAMLVYKKSVGLMYKINRAFNGRIEIMNNYHKRYGITLFPKTVNIFWDMNYTTIDNFYMYLFISCGAVITIFFMVAAYRLQGKLYEKGYYREILFFTIFSVYAMLEQSPFNPILNPFLLLAGELVYAGFPVREKGMPDN